MKAVLLDTKGNKSGTIDFPKSITAVEVKNELLSRAVRVHLINERQGTRSVKTRSEVKGRAKKPYAQKGTGSARQGSRKAPHFRGGGAAHAPRPRNFGARLLNKVNKLAIASALKKQLKVNKVFVFDSFDIKAEKLTKQLNEFLKNSKLDGNIVMAFEKVDPKIRLAGRNIGNLTIKNFNELDAYNILKPKYILVEKSVL